MKLPPFKQDVGTIRHILYPLSLYLCSAILVYALKSFSIALSLDTAFLATTCTCVLKEFSDKYIKPRLTKYEPKFDFWDIGIGIMFSGMLHAALLFIFQIFEIINQI